VNDDLTFLMIGVVIGIAFSILGFMGVDDSQQQKKDMMRRAYERGAAEFNLREDGITWTDYKISYICEGNDVR